MNVLKLLSFYWKQPLGSSEFIAIRYNIQYERSNHFQNKIYEEKRGDIFPKLKNHEDEYDKEIYKQLKQSIESIPGIKEFNIDQYEFCPVDKADSEAEIKRKLEFSKITGEMNDFYDLQINCSGNLEIKIATKLRFVDYENESLKKQIFPHIPVVIDLKFKGPIPSLIRADFLPSNSSI